MPNDPLVAGLSPFQVETYRVVMYEQEREKQEAIVKFVNQTLEICLPYLADLIVSKFSAALQGEDYGQIGRVDSEVSVSSDKMFFENLLKKGLTETDIKNLKKEGVDLSGLTFSSYETM